MARQSFEQIDKLLARLEKEELRAFLRKHVRTNKLLKGSLLAHFADKIEDESDNRYNELIQELVVTSGKEPELLLRHLKPLIKKAESQFKDGDFTESLLIYQAHIKNLEKINGDYAYVFNDLTDKVFHAFGDIIQLVPAMKKDELFEFCLVVFEQTEEIRTHIFIVLVMQDLATTEEQEERFDRTVQKEIKHQVKKRPHFHLEPKLIVAYDSYLLKKKKKEAALALLGDHIGFEPIKLRLFDRLMTYKSYDEAWKLATEEPEFTRPFDKRKWQATWWPLQLDVLRGRGALQDLRRQAKAYFYERFDLMELFVRYKSTFSEEDWVSVCDQVIIDIKNYKYSGREILYKIYAEEKRYEQLIGLIEKDLDYKERVFKYAEHLWAFDAAKTQELCGKALVIYSKTQLGKEFYIEVADTIEVLKTKPGGEAHHKELLFLIRAKNRARRTMQEVLDGRFGS